MSAQLLGKKCEQRGAQPARGHRTARGQSLPSVAFTRPEPEAWGQGFAQSLLKKMSHRSSIPGCGVTFEIVSNIPEDAQGAEERETLARMAANVGGTASADSEAYIEKYLRSVLAVENLLTLDRLRQEVAVKEQLTGKGKLSRRSISSPSMNRVSRRPVPAGPRPHSHPARAPRLTSGTATRSELTAPGTRGPACQDPAVSTGSEVLACPAITTVSVCVNGLDTQDSPLGASFEPGDADSVRRGP
ncbi:PREDICTED: uncharacterized protein LOC105853612 [Condylura cristata]|uniref:uncharacterized protein LOC105853612 n=1 Tax=Condylura cristata TaxID=143302 RepID=UPI000642E5FE|nr:PREDICTED: uncharacterized protein LOC105853612 [Condylura cristata]